MVPDCGDTYSIANGQVEYKGRSTYVNHKVPVKCNEGYKIQGDDELTCLHSGSWSTGTSCTITGIRNNKPVLSDHIKQDMCLAFQTGGRLLLNESSEKLRYLHTAISDHLSIAISMSPE